MAGFAVTMQDAVTSTPVTLGGIQRGASKRVFLGVFTISASGTPANNSILWTLQRTTTAGTHTDVTPAPHDTADAASITTAGENFSAEPTYTASTELWENGINQHAAFHWVARPGSEIVIPDTANAGLGWKPNHASYTGNAEVTAQFDE